MGKYEIIRLRNCATQLGTYHLELRITQIHHLQSCKVLKCFQEEEITLFKLWTKLLNITQY